MMLNSLYTKPDGSKEVTACFGREHITFNVFRLNAKDMRLFYLKKIFYFIFSMRK